MGLIVQKFGGSSVGDIDCIQSVARIIVGARHRGHDVVVVVSAMKGETDRLLQLANLLTLKPDMREADMLASTGEQVSAALLSVSLIAMQCPARSYNSLQLPIETEGPHGNAQVTKIGLKVLHAEIKAGCVPIIAGYQGVNAGGHITTLGRGGSDMTAVAVAAALEADECQIYTDVQGVYTSDPRVVQEAHLLSTITLAEMKELANLGAQVLQQQAVEYADQHGVSLRVLSAFEKGSGTLITASRCDNQVQRVSGIAFNRGQAKLTIIGLPRNGGASQQFLKELNRKNIDVDMMIENVPVVASDSVDFSFTVSNRDYLEALRLARAAARRLGAQRVLGDDKLAKLSVVGLGMKSHAGTASRVLQSLVAQGVKIHLITSSEIKISAIVHEKYLELGARALHAAFWAKACESSL